MTTVTSLQPQPISQLVMSKALEVPVKHTVDGKLRETESQTGSVLCYHQRMHSGENDKPDGLVVCHCHSLAVTISSDKMHIQL